MRTERLRLHGLGLSLALLLGVFAPAIAAPTLRPVDEGPRDPSFLAFRERLQAAVAGHDAKTVLAAVDPHVRTSFGDEGGIQSFEKQWRPTDPKSALWKELGSTLALGGTFRGDSVFVAPYVYSVWPESLDAFEHLAITGTGVRVRAKPSSSAKVVGRLSYALVPRARKATPEGSSWTAIRWPGKSTSYVSSAYVRSPVGWRAFFARRGGAWKLITFVSGD